MRYSDPAQFEPLFPSKRVERLYALAEKISEAALKLQSHLHPATAEVLAKLLRSMNSYYSNKIEGLSTHPVNIDRVLRKDFSKKPEIAKLQRLALAHIEAEKEIENWVKTNPNFSPFSAEGIRKIHESLYSKIPLKDRKIEKGRIVIPGEFRQLDVKVGHHIPPIHSSVPAFLNRYEAFYQSSAARDKQLIKIASAHHRLAWVHPFIDGNGRVARLAAHAALYRDFTSGLWSVCRGFARTQREYYEQLEEADSSSRGDLDGRGNLSDEALSDFCEYFLKVCLDQVNYMHKMLDSDGMRNRLRALVIFRSETENEMRREAELPLHYLFTSGPLSRSEFKQMTGLGDRVARKLLSHLIKRGLVETDSALGPVRFGLPLDALPFYFPDLYPEANTQVDEE